MLIRTTAVLHYILPGTYGSSAYSLASTVPAPPSLPSRHTALVQGKPRVIWKLRTLLPRQRLQIYEKTSHLWTSSTLPPEPIVVDSNFPCSTPSHQVHMSLGLDVTSSSSSCTCWTGRVYTFDWPRSFGHNMLDNVPRQFKRA